jgi:iron complex outermembrane receptor protein
MWENGTESKADSASVGVDTVWKLSKRSEWNAGLDYNDLGRNALRRRYNVATQMTFFDHLWPDVSQEDLAAFVEHRWTPGTDWSVRFGARLDAVASEAADVDQASLGGRTVGDFYVEFYGPEAAQVDREENLPSANIVVQRRLPKNVTIDTGLGLVTRAAGMTERYLAFGMSPKGFFVGNPTLDAEHKRELNLGARVDRRSWDGSISLYYYDIADYITPALIHEGPVDGVAGVDDVYGYLNVDATVLGGEITVAWKATPRVDLPFTIAYVRGTNETTNNPLAEIPAPELRAAARIQVWDAGNGWIEAGGRFVARQDRVDPLFNEQETPGYSVLHLRAGVTIAKQLRLYAGVENLFDIEYAEHLTPEAYFTVGDLTKGEKIPQPGRALHFSARLEY